MQTAEDQRRVVELLDGAISSLEAGDLSVRIDDELPQEYEILRTGLNTALEKLSRAFQDLVESAEHIDETANDIESATDALKTRVEHQAAELEESTEALKELTGSVTETANSANAVDQGMHSSIRKAKENEAVVERARKAMERISASSDQVFNVTTDHRFHRLSNQSPGIERPRRSCPRRRGRAGVCRRRRGGARSFRTVLSIRF